MLKIEDLKDGVYEDISHEDYLSLQTVTNSGIKDLNVSELDFWGKKHGWTEPSESNALSFGKMAHTALCEGWGEFNNQYMVKPAGMKFTNKAGKEWKEIHSEFLHCSQENYTKVKRLHEIIQAIPSYAEYFEAGQSEVTLIWTEEHDGLEIRCAARADRMNHMGITDVKTFTNQHQKPLSDCVAMQIANYKYFTQGAWYLRGLKAVKKAGFAVEIPNKFTFFFTQSDGIPNILIREFAMHTNGMRNAYYNLGQQYIDRALLLYTHCFKKFGWDNPWLLESAARPLYDDEFPRFMFPSDI